MLMPAQARAWSCEEHLEFSYAASSTAVALEMDPAACGIGGPINVVLKLNRTSMGEQETTRTSATCPAEHVCRVEATTPHPSIEYAAYSAEFIWSSSWETPDGQTQVAAASGGSTGPTCGSVVVATTC